MLRCLVSTFSFMRRFCGGKAFFTLEVPDFARRYLEFKEILPRIKRLGYNALQAQETLCEKTACRRARGFVIRSPFNRPLLFREACKLDRRIQPLTSHQLTWNLTFGGCWRRPLSFRLDRVPVRFHFNLPFAEEYFYFSLLVLNEIYHYWTIYFFPGVSTISF